MSKVLLDREARSTTLDADPTHGQLREPLLKLFHLLRTFNFGSTKQPLFHFDDLLQSIGQEHFHSPTVFNFCQLQASNTSLKQQASSTSLKHKLLAQASGTSLWHKPLWHKHEPLCMSPFHSRAPLAYTCAVATRRHPRETLPQSQTTYPYTTFTTQTT